MTKKLFIILSVISFFVIVFCKVLLKLSSAPAPKILGYFCFIFILLYFFLFLYSMYVFIKNKERVGIFLSIFLLIFLSFVAFGTRPFDYFIKNISAYSGNLNICNYALSSNEKCIKNTLEKNPDINISACDNIISDYKDDCFQQLAISKKDVSICELGETSYEIISCKNYYYYTEALEKLGKEMCYKIEEEGKIKKDVMLDKCLYKISTLKNDSELCLNLKNGYDRNECIIYLAIKNKDLSFCDNSRNDAVAKYTQSEIESCKNIVNKYTSNGKSIDDYIKYQNSRF